MLLHGRQLGERDPGSRGGLRDERHRVGRWGGPGSPVRVSTASTQSRLLGCRDRHARVGDRRDDRGIQCRCRRSCSRRCRTRSRASLSASTSRSRTSRPRGPTLAAHTSRPLRDQAASFEAVAALANYSETGRDLVTNGRAERLRVLRVTSDYFRTLRSGPLRGPGFDRRDEVGDAPRGAERRALARAVCQRVPRSSAPPFNSAASRTRWRESRLRASKIRSPATWMRGCHTISRETPTRRTTR